MWFGKEYQHVPTKKIECCHRYCHYRILFKKYKGESKRKRCAVRKYGYFHFRGLYLCQEHNTLKNRIILIWRYYLCKLRHSSFSW